MSAFAGKADMPPLAEGVCKSPKLTFENVWAKAFPEVPPWATLRR
jgi:hypothetical protein